MREARRSAFSRCRTVSGPRPISRALGVLVAIGWVLSPVSAGAQTVPDLYRFVEGPATPEMFLPSVMDARRITLNRGVLEEAEVLGLELLDGTRHTARRTKLERRGPSDLTWRGSLEESNEVGVVLTLKNDLIMGLIYAPGGVYQVDVLKDGGQVLKRLDQSRFPECAGTVEAPAPPAQAGDAFHEDPVPSGDSGLRIDVMALYTPEARDAAGGVGAIESTLQAAVDAANTALGNSNVSTQFNLVHTSLASHSDSGDLLTDLLWLQSDSGVAALRDTHGADLVSLIVQSGSGCGIGYAMRSPGPAFEAYAFQVTLRMCAVGNLSWAHEHGHNMGMEHDPANGCDPSDASYPWSFGHFVDGSFRTVMSYDAECSLGCTRVAHFSNPSVTYAGAATGIPDQRDNHRTANLTRDIVADFRQQVCSLDSEIVLENQNITTPQVYEACVSITAGPDLSIQSNVTFRAGQRIILQNGFSVVSGSSFVADIDPFLGTD